ncbi:MAG: M23 family metallopeptidase [Candidatus Rokubacteria bacterium]|nr:M23 family metallopeptidase [Candidatus Rokubacteria bacterium]
MSRRGLVLAVLVATLAGTTTIGLVVRPWSSPPVIDSPPPAPPTAVAPAPPESPSRRIAKVVLKRGDNLVRALAREGVERKTGHSMAAALVEGGADLRRMNPSDTLELEWNLDGDPVGLTYTPSPWLGYAVIASENGWEVRRSETRPDVRVEAVAGEVTRSLFHSVDAIGESPELVIELVEIFSSDFDFTADTRAGDRFRILVEKRYAEETFVDYGRVLVAQYATASRTLTGVGFEQGERWTYYDPQGRSLKKSFLKSPLEFTRITSGFTYARPHPILGGTRPHLAIDYAAPIGTPVRAVADAAVVRAGWDGGNGISVTLRHRSGYETMYNHLSKLADGVRTGARVKQRQVIGYVGSTGLSTGPHLDYRIAKNGRFVNPLSEKFLPGEPIPAADRAEFLTTARQLVRRLEDARPF